MARVFRLHTNGSNETSGWGSRLYPLGENELKTMTDNDGIELSKSFETDKPITSIPSPFAQMDLVRIAFKYLVDNVDKVKLDGNTKYHKMVSDALDVAQIFFEWDRFKNDFEIIEWNIDKGIKVLKDSYNPGQRQLGDTLELFIERNGDLYNFVYDYGNGETNLENIYLLNYIKGDAELNIVGAISPVTLFFAPANNLSVYSENIRFGNDKAFDNKPTPLYKRDADFIEWWFSLRYHAFVDDNNNSQFSKLFKEVDGYLELCYKFVDDQTKNRLRNLQKANNYMPGKLALLSFGDNKNKVKILDKNLLVKPQNTINSGLSDFGIRATKPVDGAIPLALQPGCTETDWVYLGAKWDRNIVVPYYDELPPHQRQLPGNGSQYPYLTTSDFLEDYIIELNGELNDANFFNGNWKLKENDKKVAYLLPIKDEYFNYFSVGDLQKKIGKENVFEIKKCASGVNVTLRIPVNRNNGQDCIVYSRTYYNSDMQTKADPLANTGKIVEYRDFAFAMSPSVEGAEKYYFGLISPEDKKFVLEAYDGKDSKAFYALGVRDERSNIQKNEMYLLGSKDVSGNFDRLKFVDDDFGYRGVVIPIFRPKSLSKVFTFAIDFGTTNTHIEYSCDNNKQSRPFDATLANPQLVYLLKNTVRTARHIFDSDFMPQEIGGELFKFPMRTSLCARRHNLNWTTAKAILDTNLDFTYEKRSCRFYNKPYTNLKWSTDSNTEKKVKHYIEHLFILMRNKVLCEGGILDSTKIVWTYPNSMTGNRRRELARIFKELYVVYFGGNESNVKNISESVVPYIHYKKIDGSVDNIITIDIGGGTSDVIFAADKEIKYITSFKFAADAIFGDAYTSGGITNGIVKQFGEILINRITELNNIDGKDDIIGIYEYLKNETTSSDLASYLFSLSVNPSLKDCYDIDFNDELRKDESQKIVFVIFYVALIYHIAKITKEKQLGMPRHIAFSGNGSKVISIIASDNEMLVDLTKKIFELIYDQKYDSNGLTIFDKPQNGTPKDVTSKGAIRFALGEAKDINLENLDEKFVVGGINMNVTTYAQLSDRIKSNIDVSEISEFFDFVFNKLNAKFNFYKNFGVTNSFLDIAKNVCSRDLKTYMKNGVENKLEDVQDRASSTDPIEETLFFYPIVGVLNALAHEIYNSIKQS